MDLLPLSESDKSWQSLQAQWRGESADLKDDFSTFAVGTFGALNPIAQEDVTKSGLYGLHDGKSFKAFCQVTRLLMKGYDSPVLRARFATVSPKFDLGTHNMADYVQVLTHLFSGIVWLARSRMPAKHVRFHLRSPADAQYFFGLASTSLEGNPFSKFEIRGAWIECTLR